MNTYQERQEERRERMLEKAARLEAAADALNDRARGLSECMNGTPVLVGHHSEGRHRRDLRRLDSWWGKARECSEKAKRLRERAESVGRAGIASDDPDAPEKLAERIAKLEARHARMVALNRSWRRAGKPDFQNEPEKWLDWAKSTDLSEKERRVLAARKAAFPYSWERQPFAAYELTNSSGNIRRLKARLADLEKMAEAPKDDIQGDGFVISVNEPEGRIQVYDTPKDPTVSKTMRRCGYVWSRRNTCWQRKITPNAMGGIDHVRRCLEAALEQVRAA